MGQANRMACLILGAGRSERFGPASKLDARLGHKRVGDHAPDMLARFEFADLVFVARPGGFVPAAPQFRIAETADPRAGLGHSLATGVAALRQSDCDSVLIALADMPLVEPSHVAALLDAFSSNRDGVASSNGDGVSPPAILPLHALALLEDAQEDQGARALLKRAFRVPAPQDSLLDIDSVDDLVRANANVSARSPVQDR